MKHVHLCFFLLLMALTSQSHAQSGSAQGIAAMDVSKKTSAIFKELITPKTKWFEFDIKKPVPTTRKTFESYGGFTEPGFGVALEHANNKGWFVFDSTLCDIADGKSTTCYIGLGKRGAACAISNTPEGKSVLICDITILAGTGLLAKGEAYFGLSGSLSFMGYLPTYEYVTGWDVPGIVEWKASNKLDDETRTIKRCAIISFSTDDESKKSKITPLCEEYLINLETSRIVHKKGKDTKGSLLMEVYKDVGERLAKAN